MIFSRKIVTQITTPKEKFIDRINSCLTVLWRISRFLQNEFPRKLRRRDKVNDVFERLKLDFEWNAREVCFKQRFNLAGDQTVLREVKKCCRVQEWDFPYENLARPHTCSRKLSAAFGAKVCWALTLICRTFRRNSAAISVYQASRLAEIYAQSLKACAKAYRCRWPIEEEASGEIKRTDTLLQTPPVFFAYFRVSIEARRSKEDCQRKTKSTRSAAIS